MILDLLVAFLEGNGGHATILAATKLFEHVHFEHLLLYLFVNHCGLLQSISRQRATWWPRLLPDTAFNQVWVLKAGVVALGLNR